MVGRAWSALPVLGAVLALVVLERAIELGRARRHTRRLLARGAVEWGARHYPYLVAAHVLFYVGLAIETALRRPPADLACASGLALFAVAQVARLAVLQSLGNRWTTRVVVLPGAPLVRRGPYRFLRHPNYVVVVTELVALALAFRAWATLGFAVASQAIVLAARLRTEDQALGTRGE